MSDFGANFRNARESLGISVDQIAGETRISTRFLRAIEDEEFHLLPGGIFNRGFIRTYATRLGLDPEQAVTDYEQLTETREPEEFERPVSAEPSKVERNLYPIALGALFLLVMVFYVVQRDTDTTGETATPSAAEAPAPVPPPSEPSPAAAPPAESAAVPAETGRVQPQQATPPQQTVPAKPVPPPPAQKPPPGRVTLALEMEALEPTWVKVSTDGNPVIAGAILQPGDTRRYTAQSSIDLTIGNATGVIIRINGREIRSLGRSGQVRSIVITPENVKKFTG